MSEWIRFAGLTEPAHVRRDAIDVWRVQGARDLDSRLGAAYGKFYIQATTRTGSLVWMGPFETSADAESKIVEFTPYG